LACVDATDSMGARTTAPPGTSIAPGFARDFFRIVAMHGGASDCVTPVR
jgi:hypothetical protein